MLTDDQEKELKTKKKEKEELENTLKRKKNDSARQKKSREAKRVALEAAFQKNPSLKSQLKIRGQPGRPRIETEQPKLLETIVQIAIHGSAAYDKRRNDVYRSVKTLDELTAALNQEGFSIKRSALYLRLLPKRRSSQEGLLNILFLFSLLILTRVFLGKRHVVTVPARLIRAQNDHHAKHVDTAFCSATIHRLEELPR